MNVIAAFSRLRLSEQALRRYLVLVLSVYLIWLGGLKLTPSELKMSDYWLSNSSLFAPLLQWLPLKTLALLMMVAEVLAGVLVLTGLWGGRQAFLGAAMAMVIFGLNLLYLFTNPIFVEGWGFPYLGAGQGLIKYLAMLAVAGYLFVDLGHQSGRFAWVEAGKGLMTHLAMMGIVLVMGWIGFLKFHSYEAEGIVRLMESNLLFSWTYDLWDVQGASNFIGSVELLFMGLIVCFPVSRVLGCLGVAGIAATALGTLSFLFSVPGWNPEDQFPLLNGTGVFILKDQLLLAAALILWHRYPPGEDC
ncbi:DUF417 family protein [Ferrimonas sp. SCSIO 43195]|uniref:DUF417 family protein n=1 Tax=Ferrimonas sp. SCSIO 43195 TaxID=2822844 RepID=UPI0020761C80|nr:DUF417 family protein [Ferrimonas sp. SCSIO 43195]USD38342.1 DUF417 family protein [Ferrimonas sp. SCSIO 43195]